MHLIIWWKQFIIYVCFRNLSLCLRLLLLDFRTVLVVRYFLFYVLFIEYFFNTISKGNEWMRELCISIFICTSFSYALVPKNSFWFLCKYVTPLSVTGISNYYIKILDYNCLYLTLFLIFLWWSVSILVGVNRST